MNRTCYFVECTPKDGRFIRYGRYTGNEDTPILPTYAASIGRWNSELGVIVTANLNIVSLDGTAGYCWEYAENITFTPASFTPLF